MNTRKESCVVFSIVFFVASIFLIASNASAQVALAVQSLATGTSVSTTKTTASITSTLTSTGGNPSTNVGIEYGPTTSYIHQAAFASPLTTAGDFVSNLDGLDCGTAYHYRAYAENSDGNAQGSDATFFTSACVTPTVTTDSSTSISATSAVLNGTIADTGGRNATTRGFQYGLTSGYGTTVSEAGSFGAGAFNAVLSNLTCATTYHYAAYASYMASIGGEGAPVEMRGNGSDATFTTADCHHGGRTSPTPPTPPTPPSVPPLTGNSGGGCALGKVDTNNDCRADIIDFVALMMNWNKTDSGNSADFNSDSSVDIGDFTLLMTSWTI